MFYSSCRNETSRAFQRAILTPRCHCETTLYPHSSCITDSASEEVDVIEDIGNNCSSPRHYHFSTVAQAAVLAALSRGSSLDEPAYSQRENGTEFQNISNKLASWVRQTCDYEDRKPLNAAAFLIKESVRCQEDW